MFRIKLKQLREERGYSQYSFAETFGVAQSTVGNWESGKREPNFDTMQRLADFFGVSIDYLMGRESRTRDEEKSSREILMEQLGDTKFALYKESESLTEEDMEDVLLFMKLLKEKKKKGEKK